MHGKMLLLAHERVRISDGANVTPVPVARYAIPSACRRLPRYFALQQVVMIGASSLGLPALGALMAILGPRIGLGLAGGGMVLVAIVGLLAISAGKSIGVNTPSPVK